MHSQSLTQSKKQAQLNFPPQALVSTQMQQSLGHFQQQPLQLLKATSSQLQNFLKMKAQSPSQQQLQRAMQLPQQKNSPSQSSQQSSIGKMQHLQLPKQANLMVHQKKQAQKNISSMAQSAQHLQQTTATLTLQMAQTQSLSMVSMQQMVKTDMEQNAKSQKSPSNKAILSACVVISKTTTAHLKSRTQFS